MQVASHHSEGMRQLDASYLAAGLIIITGLGCQGFNYPVNKFLAQVHWQGAGEVVCPLKSGYYSNVGWLKGLFVPFQNEQKWLLEQKLW